MKNFKPKRRDRMEFELSDWFTRVEMERMFLDKCSNEDIEDVCVALGNIFEDRLKGLSYDTIEELFFETFPESDIDVGGMLPNE